MKISLIVFANSLWYAEMAMSEDKREHRPFSEVSAAEPKERAAAHRVDRPTTHVETTVADDSEASVLSHLRGEIVESSTVVQLDGPGQPFVLSGSLEKAPFIGTKGGSKEFFIFAEFEVAGIPPLKAALVKQTEDARNFYLVDFEERDGKRALVTDRTVPPLVVGEEGYASNASKQVSVVLLGDNVFTIESENDDGKQVTFNSIEARLPDQSESRKKLASLAQEGNPLAREVLRNEIAKEEGTPPTLSPEAINWEQSRTEQTVLAAAKDFPDDVTFALDLHSGAYEFDDEYLAKIKEQIKGSWMILAEEVGLDPHSFPLDKISLWAPSVTDTKGLSLWKKIKNGLHKRREKAKQFDTSSLSYTAGIYTNMGAGSLDLAVPASGTIEFGTTAHELFHAALAKRKIFTRASLLHRANYGHVIDEGLGKNGNMLVAEAVAGKPMAVVAKHTMLTPTKAKGYELLDSDFAALVEVSQDEPLSKGEQQYGAYYDLLKYDHSVVNAIVHRYLLAERGGFDRMKELTQSAVRTRKGLLAAYKNVYNDSYPELVMKAKDWYSSLATH